MYSPRDRQTDRPIDRPTDRPFNRSGQFCYHVGVRIRHIRRLVQIVQESVQAGQRLVAVGLANHAMLLR